jgi:hypothetical protein
VYWTAWRFNLFQIYNCKITKLFSLLSKHSRCHKCFYVFALCIRLQSVTFVVIKIDFSRHAVTLRNWSAKNTQSNGWSFKFPIFCTVHSQFTCQQRVNKCYLSQCEEYTLPDSATPDYVLVPEHPLNSLPSWGEM